MGQVLNHPSTVNRHKVILRSLLNQRRNEKLKKGLERRVFPFFNPFLTGFQLEASRVLREDLPPTIGPLPPMGTFGLRTRGQLGRTFPK